MEAVVSEPALTSTVTVMALPFSVVPVRVWRTVPLPSLSPPCVKTPLLSLSVTVVPSEPVAFSSGSLSASPRSAENEPSALRVRAVPPTVQPLTVNCGMPSSSALVAALNAAASAVSTSSPAACSMAALSPSALSYLDRSFALALASASAKFFCSAD